MKRLFSILLLVAFFHAAHSMEQSANESNFVIQVISDKKLSNEKEQSNSQSFGSEHFENKNNAYNVTVTIPGQIQDTQEDVPQENFQEKSVHRPNLTLRVPTPRHYDRSPQHSRTPIPHRTHGRALNEQEKAAFSQATSTFFSQYVLDLNSPIAKNLSASKQLLVELAVFNFLKQNQGLHIPELVELAKPKITTLIENYEKTKQQESCCVIL